MSSLRQSLQPTPPRFSPARDLAARPRAQESVRRACALRDASPAAVPTRRSRAFAWLAAAVIAASIVVAGYVAWRAVTAPIDAAAGVMGDLVTTIAPTDEAAAPAEPARNPFAR